MRTEVRLSGFGGQGIVLSGYILGKAASLFAGKAATMTQSYGPEARGGACTSNVVIDDERVSYPAVTHPDILVLMSQEAFHTYRGGFQKGVKVLYDKDLVKLEEGLQGEHIPVPASQVADQLGKKIVANIVMLGFLAAASGVLPKEAVKEAVASSVPAHTRELNEKAFERGFEEGLKTRGKGA